MNQPDGTARSSDLYSASPFSEGQMLCSACGLRIPMQMEDSSFCNPLDLSPATSTILRVSKLMAGLRKDGHAKEFLLSAHALFETTFELDMVSRVKMGFGYAPRLRLECMELVPSHITENNFDEQFLAPLAHWRLNRRFFLCGGLGMALLLAVIHRLIRWDGTLAEADFSKLAVDMMACPLETLPVAFREDVTSPLKNRGA